MIFLFLLAALLASEIVAEQLEPGVRLASTVPVLPVLQRPRVVTKRVKLLDSVEAGSGVCEIHRSSERTMGCSNWPLHASALSEFLDEEHIKQRTPHRLENSIITFLAAFSYIPSSLLFQSKASASWRFAFTPAFRPTLGPLGARCQKHSISLPVPTTALCRSGDLGVIGLKPIGQAADGRRRRGRPRRTWSATT